MLVRLTRFILFLITLSCMFGVVSAATMTFYPVHDAAMYTSTTGAYATLRAASGTGVVDNSTSNYPSTYLAGSTGTTQFSSMYRIGLTFANVSASLPAGSTITGATITTYNGYEATVNTLGGTGASILVRGMPTNPVSYVAGDYARYYPGTIYSNTMTWSGTNAGTSSVFKDRKSVV